MSYLTECPERPELVQGDTELIFVDLRKGLDDGELATGTPTVTELGGTTNLAFGNQAVNTAAVVIKGETVAIGKAVQFKLTGHLGATGSYSIKVTFSTNSTPARTKSVKCNFTAVAMT